MFPFRAFSPCFTILGVTFPCSCFHMKLESAFIVKLKLSFPKVLLSSSQQNTSKSVSFSMGRLAGQNTRKQVPNALCSKELIRTLQFFVTKVLLYLHLKLQNEQAYLIIWYTFPCERMGTLKYFVGNYYLA